MKALALSLTVENSHLDDVTGRFIDDSLHSRIELHSGLPLINTLHEEGSATILAEHLFLLCHVLLTLKNACKKHK